MLERATKFGRDWLQLLGSLVEVRPDIIPKEERVRPLVVLFKLRTFRELAGENALPLAEMVTEMVMATATAATVQVSRRSLKRSWPPSRRRKPTGI